MAPFRFFLPPAQTSSGGKGEASEVDVSLIPPRPVPLMLTLDAMAAGPDDATVPGGTSRRVDAT